MTIAACYVTSEGVVLGSDSTSTMYVPSPDGFGQDHHYNFAQKIFELGEGSSIAITTWGLGELPGISYRTLFAQFAEQNKAVRSVKAAARRWAVFFWAEYLRRLRNEITNIQGLAANPQKTPDEEKFLRFLLNTRECGFCIAGVLGSDRRPRAYSVIYSPLLTEVPDIEEVRYARPTFWGCPNAMRRVLFGIDFEAIHDILRSGHWTGTQDQFFQLLDRHRWVLPTNLPIRDAIDFVASAIYTTIKATKFSHLPPVCGGPVEVAVITSDRRFRWVLHKTMREAIDLGQPFPKWPS